MKACPRKCARMGKIKLESCSLTRARIHVIPRRAKRTFPLSAHKFENNDDNDTATRPKWQGARGEEQNVAAAKHLVAAASSSSCVSTVPDTRMNPEDNFTTCFACCKETVEVRCCSRCHFAMRMSSCRLDSVASRPMQASKRSLRAKGMTRNEVQTELLNSECREGRRVLNEARATNAPIHTVSQTSSETRSLY